MLVLTWIEYRYYLKKFLPYQYKRSWHNLLPRRKWKPMQPNWNYELIEIKVVMYQK